jgi:hypothetical protein
MTIHITVKNEDSRANAIIEVLSIDTYSPYTTLDGPLPTKEYVKSEAILRGGESKQVYVTSTMHLEIIERQNG